MYVCGEMVDTQAAPLLRGEGERRVGGSIIEGRGLRGDRRLRVGCKIVRRQHHGQVCSVGSRIRLKSSMFYQPSLQKHFNISTIQHIHDAPKINRIHWKYLVSPGPMVQARDPGYKEG